MIGLLDWTWNFTLSTTSTPEPNGYLVPTAYRGAAHEPVSIVQYTAAARERRLYENVMQ